VIDACAQPARESDPGVPPTGGALSEVPIFAQVRPAVAPMYILRAMPVVIENPTYPQTLRRAKEKLKRAIRQQKIPRPQACDGCGGGGQLSLYIFDPGNYACFSAYCLSCWSDHRCDEMAVRRRRHFEAEEADHALLAA